LLREVNLETDVEHDVVLLLGAIGNATGERDDGHKVDESGAVLSIIEEICLALLVSCETLLHVRDGFLVGMMTVFSFGNAATRCLEKTTVTAKNFILVIPCHTIEGGRGIYDGTVVSPHVHHDKRTRHINRTEIDARILSIGDAD
jgi:hypothetical protein